MPGTVERTFALKLIGDVKDISRALPPVTRDLAKADRQAGKLKGSLKGLGASALSWGKAFTGALVVDGLEAVTDALGDAWAGFRSGQRVAAQLGVTWRNLGLASGDLAGTLDRVTAAATRVGMSDDDAVAAFDASIKRTRDSEASYREFKIAMDLVANKSAPNLKGAMRMIQQASKGSARVVDSFGLTSKTAGGRVRELGRRVKGAAKRAADLDPFGVLVNGINEDLEGIVGSLATGDIDGAIDAIAGAAGRLDEAWSKAFPDVQATLDGLTGGSFSGFADTMGAFVDGIAPKLAPYLSAASAAFSAAAAGVSNLLDFVRPLTDLVGSAVAGSLGASLDATTGILNTVAALLRGDFQGAVGAAQTALQRMADTVSSAFERVLQAIRRIAQNIVNVWNSLGRIPAGSFQLWGPSWWGIPGTDVGAEIPGLGFSWGATDVIPNLPNVLRQNWGTGGATGGTGPSGGRGRHSSGPPPIASRAPRVPGHAGGLDYVPRDDYLMRAHRGEAVLDARDAAEWRSGGGTTYVFNFAGAPVMDKASLGRMMVEAADAYFARGGTSRALARR